MPTRKQRRRAAKDRRHEYETVWVDSEGNELEEPPEEAAVATRERRDDGKAKPKSQQKRPQRGSRATRVPPPPSWGRSIRRSLIWAGVLVALLFWLQSRAKHPDYAGMIPIDAIYILLFPVFTYMLDRSMYRRYEKQQGQRDSAKKR